MARSQNQDSKFLFGTGLLVLFGLGCFILGAFIGPAWALPGEPLSYNDFEKKIRTQAFSTAVVDGNIISLSSESGKTFRVEAPDVGRAVGLLIKFDVLVKAHRPVPASGVTWPVVFALLIPYGIIAFYAFALAKAAAPDEPEYPAQEKAKPLEDDC